MKATPGHTWATTEELLEAARQQLNPLAPSRPFCTFVCEDIAAAREFQLNRPGDAIYEAHLEDSNSPQHRANVRLIHPEMVQFFGWDWRVQAREYWVPTVHTSEPGTEFVAEVLVAGPIRLGRLVEGR